jgi:hypothetical protein
MQGFFENSAKKASTILQKPKLFRLATLRGYNQTAQQL